MGSLIEMVFGMPAARFVAEHWLQRPLHVAGAIDRVAELASDPSAPRAWFDRFVADLALAFAAPAADVHRTRRPAATSAPWRFDHRELVIVQLAGRERWRIARNDTLPTPLSGHVAGTPLHPLDRALADHVDVPTDAETFTAEPGSVTYLPRGTWYQLEALDDSSTCAFGFKLPTWIELVINTAMVELGRDLGWRELGTADDGDHDSAMQRSIEALRALRPPRGPGQG